MRNILSRLGMVRICLFLGLSGSAAWHGKLATCVLYAVILAHIVWYAIPQPVSA